MRSAFTCTDRGCCSTTNTPVMWRYLQLNRNCSDACYFQFWTKGLTHLLISLTALYCTTVLPGTNTEPTWTCFLSSGIFQEKPATQRLLQCNMDAHTWINNPALQSIYHTQHSSQVKVTSNEKISPLNYSHIKLPLNSTVPNESVPGWASTEVTFFFFNSKYAKAESPQLAGNIYNVISIHRWKA